MIRSLAAAAAFALAAAPALAQSADAFLARPGPGDVLGTRIIGEAVHAAGADFEADAPLAPETFDDWERLGAITDVLLTREGRVKAVLVDVGGFLGLGEKTVAIRAERLRLAEHPGTGRLYVIMRGDASGLEEAPAFVRREPGVSQDQAAGSLEPEGEGDGAE